MKLGDSHANWYSFGDRRRTHLVYLHDWYDTRGQVTFSTAFSIGMPVSDRYELVDGEDDASSAPALTLSASISPGMRASRNAAASSSGFASDTGVGFAPSAVP